MTMTGMRALSLCTRILFLSLPGVAAAAPPKTTHIQTATSKDPIDGASGLLRRGRALVASGRFAEAVKVLDAALRKAPDDPRVLNELGVALREVGDLVRAEAACRQAAKAEPPKVRASALYNLGRVLERQGDTWAAISAYQESLQLRHTRTVRERIIEIDPTGTSEVTRTHPLQGPLPSIEEWCKQQKEERCGPEAFTILVSLPDPDPSHPADPRWLPGKHAPWEEVRVFDLLSHDRDCVVGLRTNEAGSWTGSRTARQQ